MYLVTYRPLCGTAAGIEAIKRYGLPPFIDSSCRREPDLESKFPTITALCRGGNFAPRLNEGDLVAYITTQPWHLTAIIRVVKKLTSHEEAAKWFRSQNLPLPSNCMVPGNKAEPAARTGGLRGCASVKTWDDGYKARAKAHGVVLVCEAEHLELHNPPRITREDWFAWNDGKVPATQNPTTWPHLEKHLWAATSKNSPASVPPGRPRSGGSGSGRATISSGSRATSPRRGC